MKESHSQFRGSDLRLSRRNLSKGTVSIAGLFALNSAGCSEPNPQLIVNQPQFKDLVNPVENQLSLNAKVNLGDCQLEVMGWEEPKVSAFIDSSFDRNSKVVVARALLRNTSGKPLSKDFFKNGDNFELGFTDLSGRVMGIAKVYQFLDWGGTLERPYIQDRDRLVIVDDSRATRRISSDVVIPQGSAMPISIVGQLESGLSQYGLVVIPKKATLSNPQEVGQIEGLGLVADKNKIIKRGEVLPNTTLVSPEFRLKGAGEVGEMSGLEVGLLGVSEKRTSTKTDQYVNVSLTNKTEQILYGVKNSLNIFIALPDRRLVVAKPSIEAEDILRQGVKQDYSILIASSKPSTYFNKPFDFALYEALHFSGSKVIVSYQSYGLNGVVGWQI